MIPPELSSRPQWVVWKTVDRGGRPTKIPFQVDGTMAKSNDPATWNTVAACLDVSEGYSGVGFVFSADDDLIGIDLDGCRNKDSGLMSGWASEIIKRFQTYTEVSPSGTGVKLFGRSSKRWLGQNKKELEVDKVSGKNPAIEIYDRERYFAFTGEVLAGYEKIAMVDEQLDWLTENFKLGKQSVYVSSVELSSSVEERAAKYVEKMDPSISGSGGHNAAFKAACVLVKGFALTDAEAYRVFQSAFNVRCQPPWSEREIMHKISQAGKQPGSSGYLRDAHPEQWPKIKLPTNYKEQAPQQSATPKKFELTDVVTSGLKYLESIKHGRKPLIRTGIPELDYAIGGGIADGEMVVVAARPSHGKSAIALQMSHEMTGDGLPVVIVSEEMSSMQLGKRAIQYAVELQERDWSENLEHAKSEFQAYFDGRANAFIIESTGSVMAACEAIEFAVETHGVRVAFIDYVQILSAPGKDRYSQVTAASQALRQLASRLKIPIVVLAQFSREMEKREKFQPSTRDLKESGQIEQDADVILGCVWPKRLDNSLPADKYQIYILKNRNRETMKWALEIEFDPTRQRFWQPGLRQHLNDFAGDFR